MVCFKVIDKEFIEFVLTIGKYQTWSIVFNLFNDLKSIFNLIFIEFLHSFIFYFLLKFCNNLLIFSHFIFVLIFLAQNLLKFLLCVLFIFLYLLTLNISNNYISSLNCLSSALILRSSDYFYF